MLSDSLKQIFAVGLSIFKRINLTILEVEKYKPEWLGNVQLKQQLISQKLKPASLHRGYRKEHKTKPLHSVRGVKNFEI